MIFADPSGKRWRRIKRGGFFVSTLVGIPPLLLVAGGFIYEPTWAELALKVQKIVAAESTPTNSPVTPTSLPDAPSVSARTIAASPKTRGSTTRLASAPNQKKSLSLDTEQETPAGPADSVAAPTQSASETVQAFADASELTTPAPETSAEPTPLPSTEPELEPEPQSPGRSAFGHSHGKSEAPTQSDLGRNHNPRP